MRIIARIDIKNEYAIKSINLEGNRKVGDPNSLGVKYYKDKADEIIFMDSVASLYGNNNLFELIKKISKNIFVPITIGGGLRTISDMTQALNCGADKVAINSAAIKNPKLIKDAVKIFGSSTVVVSIETKKNAQGDWEIFYKNGREPSKILLYDWIKITQEFDCGELLITSINNEGTKKGFDLELLYEVEKMNLRTPIIFSGGCGKLEHIENIKSRLKHDAIAIASVLHYDLLKIKDIKKNLGYE
ncbi:imidazole glycerol phosphate synthase subunit HisF [Candidatus Pelagibacter sp. Uisw_127]|uniref:imidazole glycerol phosphate synthase subunit HisF n=1 Tax=Candidatus Pelagibacter sp. Uisw_127 TaxID=3230988 RepID=UPI0039E9E610